MIWNTTTPNGSWFWKFVCYQIWTLTRLLLLLSIQTQSFNPSTGTYLKHLNRKLWYFSICRYMKSIVPTILGSAKVSWIMAFCRIHIANVFYFKGPSINEVTPILQSSTPHPPLVTPVKPWNHPKLSFFYTPLPLTLRWRHLWMVPNQTNWPSSRLRAS